MHFLALSIYDNFKAKYKARDIFPNKILKKA